MTPSFRGQVQQLVQAAELEMNDVQAQVSFTVLYKENFLSLHFLMRLQGIVFQVGIVEPFSKLIGVVTSCEAEIRARDDVTKVLFINLLV